MNPMMRFAPKWAQQVCAYGIGVDVVGLINRVNTPNPNQDRAKKMKHALDWQLQNDLRGGRLHTPPRGRPDLWHVAPCFVRETHEAFRTTDPRGYFVTLDWCHAELALVTRLAGDMEANKLLTDPGTDIFRHLAALTDCPRALAKEAVYRLIYGRRHSTAGNYIPPQLWDVIEQLLPKTSVTSSTKEGASTLMRVAMRELAAARADATQKLQEAGHKVCLVGHDYLVVDVPDSWAQGKFGVFDREDAHHKALHQSPVVTKNSLEVAQTFAAAGGGLVVTYQVGNLVGLWGSKHKGNQTHTLALDNTAT